MLRRADRVPHDDPDFAPLVASDFAGLPPGAIIAAGIDPLCQDAEDYAAFLLARRIRVRYRVAPGLVHGGLRPRQTSSAAAGTFADIAAALSELAARSTQPIFTGRAERLPRVDRAFLWSAQTATGVSASFTVLA
jgi:acetyl esterase/lipase